MFTSRRIKDQGDGSLTHFSIDALDDSITNSRDPADPVIPQNKEKAPLPVVRAERPISYAYSAESGGMVSVGSTNPSPVVSPSSVSKGEPHNSRVVTISTTSTTGFM